MTQPAETVEERLDAIAATLVKIQGDHVKVLKVFEETNARYRREIDDYSAERASRRFAVSLGSFLRIAAVALLAYIAFRLP